MLVLTYLSCQGSPASSPVMVKAAGILVWHEARSVDAVEEE